MKDIGIRTVEVHPDGGGGVIAADALHRAELAALADRFATVVPDTAALP